MCAMDSNGASCRRCASPLEEPRLNQRPISMLPLKSILVAMALALAQLPAQAAPLVLHVAPDGDDGWSGTLPGPNPAKGDGPVASIGQALRNARKAKAEGHRESITIRLRGGAHRLAEPLVLTELDSGVDAANPLVIESFPGERAVISGGRLVGGWSAIEGRPGFWRTHIPEVASGGWYFRSLFLNGGRLTRARTPNSGFFRIRGASSQDKPFRLAYPEGAIRPSWAGPGSDVEVVAYLAWSDIRMQIRAVDEASRIAVLAGDPRPSNRESDARFIVENAPELVDEPGEWHLDRRSGEAILMLAPGIDPNQAEITAPLLPHLVSISGNFETGSAAKHIVLRGLVFQHTDHSLGPKGLADTQAAIEVRGDLRFEAVEDCVVEDSEFSCLSGYAIEAGRGAKRLRIAGNLIRDMGAGGVRLGETTQRTTPFEASHGHEVTDNEMTRLGRIFAPAVGVFILQSGSNRVAHNHIHDLYYTAISIGWNWGYQETPCRDNLVEFNHLHHIGQGMLSDMGAVYTLGIQHGTVIRNNVVHDVESFTYGGWGLYTDEGSTGIVLENNLVYRTKSAGFHQHYGRDNVVRNNIFAFGREYQLMRTREENHLSFTFTNNIVYFDSGELLGSNWANNQFKIDGNIYWDIRQADTPGAMRFKGETLERWRGRGHDLESIIADPLFVAPGKGDFRLRPNSPAIAKGFKPLDLARVGVRPKGVR